MKLKLFIISLFIFIGIGFVWLGLVAPEFYQAQFGHLMAETTNIAAAGVFYVLFVAVLVYFVLEPAVDTGTIRDGLVRGTLFGLVSYATYDLTNFATLRDWPLLVTIRIWPGERF